MPDQIYVTFLSTPLGHLEIKSDSDFIRSVMFVEEQGFGSTEQPEVLNNCKTQLQEYFTAQRFEFDIPVQQAGTTFQQQVWKELLKIPFGKTTSYLALSKQLNNTGAIRAVGTANGKNKLSILIPCHRVIGADGKLTGYSGGLYRKQWLLEHEAKMKGTSSLLF